MLHHHRTRIRVPIKICIHFGQHRWIPSRFSVMKTPTGAPSCDCLTRGIGRGAVLHLAVYYFGVLIKDRVDSGTSKRDTTPYFGLNWVSGSAFNSRMFVIWNSLGFVAPKMKAEISQFVVICALQYSLELGSTFEIFILGVMSTKWNFCVLGDCHFLLPKQD